MSPIEHRDLPQRDPLLLAQLQHPLGHELGLLVDVAQRDQRRPHPGGADGPERLGVLLHVAPDRGVGQLEDLGTGAVVDLQLVDLRLGEAPRELQDVAEVRAAEGVDALGVVAHHRQVAVLRRAELDDLALQQAGILILVDQHVLEAIGELTGHGGVLGQQDLEEEQQIVVVDQPQLELALDEAVDGALDLLGHREESRRVEAQRLIQPELGVDGPGEQVQQQAGLGEAAAAQHRAGLGDAGRHEVSRVLSIEDGVVGGEPHGLRVLAQREVGDVVERAGPGGANLQTQQLLDAADHLSCRAVGEGAEHDAIMRQAASQQVGGPIGQGAGLSGASTGDDQQLPRRRQHRGALLLVEVRQIEGAGPGALGAEDVPGHDARGASRRSRVEGAAARRWCWRRGGTSAIPRAAAR